MERTGVERRLTTILAADVANYSRLMAADEAATLAKLKSLQTEIIGPRTVAFHGRMVKLMGDGILMEFGSVVAAVEFAVDLQRALPEWNDRVDPERPFALRIGINISDIIVEGDDIYGDGVNISARLEALAEPGSICISAKVHDEVRNKIAVPFRDLGRREVKNIPEPVHVFEVLVGEGGGGAALAACRRARPQSLRWPAAAVAVLVLLGAVAGYLWLRQPGPRPESEAPEVAAPLADAKPSLVVLPFANLSGDPNQEYFADGMTEDLTTDLAKVPGLFVISRNSAFTFKGKAVKVTDVAAELRVKYVLEGSVRRVGDRVRISAQLIEAATDGHLWADRFDGELSDVFTLQDKVTAKIIEAMAVHLMPGQVPGSSGPGTSNAAAHDAYLRGLSLYYRRKPDENAQAASHFRRAIDLDPGYVAAYTALAKVYVQAAIGEHAYAERLQIHWAEGYAKAWRLLEQGMARPNADFHVLRSWLALRKRQYRVAVVEAEQALELNPNDADALEALAEASIYAGRPEVGIEYASKAMRQNPTLRGRPLYLTGVAEFALGNSARAVQRIEQAIVEQPDRKADFAGVLAAAYGDLGRADEAHSAFQSFSQGIVNRPSMAWSVKSEAFTNPRYHTWRRVDLAWAVFSHPFAERATLDRLATGLVVAGAPESVGGYLMLDRSSRLNGGEIETLLFGKKIRGKNFWISELLWQQQRTADGKVNHKGDPIHAGLPETATARGRIEGDMLCEIWPTLTKGLELCVVIFRVTDRNARLRWGDYVMVTDIGPQPFSLNH